MASQTVVLDWDGTLAFSHAVPNADSENDAAPSSKMILSVDRNGEEGRFALFIRPYAPDFLLLLAKEYQLVLWTFGVARYIRECMQQTQWEHFFSHIIVREDMPVPVKDLLTLGVPLTRTVIIDDSNETFGVLNPYNCVDISSWSPTIEDDQVLKIMPYVIRYHFQNVLSGRSENELVDLREAILQKIRQLAASRPVPAPDIT